MSPTLTSPPPSPDVAQQQQPELARYAMQASQQQGSPQQQNFVPSGPTPLELAEAKMNLIAQTIVETAQALQYEKPVLLVYLRKMGEVGQALMKEIQEAKQQTPGGVPTAGLEPDRPQQGAPPEGASNVTT